MEDVDSQEGASRNAEARAGDDMIALREEKKAFRETLITDKELNECDKIELHLLGKIQQDCSHVIFITYPETRIVAVDANIADLSFVFGPQSSCAASASNDVAGTSSSSSGGGGGAASSSANASTSSSSPDVVHQMLGSVLRDWMSDLVIQRLQRAIQDMITSESDRGFTFLAEDSTFYAISISTTKQDFSLIGIEIEIVHDEHIDKTFTNTLLYLSKVLDLHTDDKVAKKACDIMFDLFEDKYDRGMVYKFHDDLSGEIIHEIKRPKSDIESSYLGHRFPASDIPQSARDLYRKNILRYIHNSGASNDVPIVSLPSSSFKETKTCKGEGVCDSSNETDQKQKHTAHPIDLTQVRSRACHKAHLIYMKNMGVVCSMSLAIIVDGDLWGLLVFHGYKQPFKPSLHTRIACETITSMLSARIESLMKKAQNARIVGVGEALMRWRQGAPLSENLHLVGESVLEMSEADVIVALVENPSSGLIERFVVGDETLVPSVKFWDKLRTYPNRMVCYKSKRDSIDEMGLSETDCPAAGFAYFREGRTQVMVGRAWRTRGVKWAGRPDEPKLRIGDILNPRHSFATHMEHAFRESRAWTPSDQLIVSILKDRLCTEHCYNWIVTLLHNDIEEANQRYFNELKRADENNHFFASMCHELRTPFHGVMGCLNIIHDSFDEMEPEDMKDLVKTALSSGYHMINLLNDVLNKSKNKFLLTENFMGEVELSSLAEDAISGMRTLAKNLNLIFHCEVGQSSGKDDGDDDMRFVTDRTKVIQITTNIVNNAIKFSGKYSTVDVRFKLVTSMDEATADWLDDSSRYEGKAFSFSGGEIVNSADSVREISSSSRNNVCHRWLCVSVANSGMGMTQDEVTKLLTPHSKSNTPSHERQVLEGTGLGLFICTALCQQLRGFLGCCSTPSQGTIYHVGIPVLDAKGRPILSTTMREDGSTDEITSSDIPITGPIMIVDDNRVNIKILSRALRVQLDKSGINLKLVTAEGGAEAVHMYRQELPSVVIIDYHMPEIDGLEATMRIRTFERDRGLVPSYILSYTADASNIARQKLLASGANDIMAKPPAKDFIPTLVSRFRVSTATTPTGPTPLMTQTSSNLSRSRDNSPSSSSNTSLRLGVLHGSRSFAPILRSDEGGVGHERATKDAVKKMRLTEDALKEAEAILTSVPNASQTTGMPYTLKDKPGGC